MTQRQLCTFRLDGMPFGVEVHRVQEVLRHLPITRVPLAVSVVAGLINLRGQIVTAIDLRRRLGLRDRPEGAQPMNVVVRHDDGIASLLVDEIGEVIEVDDADFEPVPSTLRGAVREMITGVYKLERQLLSLLDVERTLEVTAMPADAAARGERGMASSGYPVPSAGR
jgi:purine-binding chemotaxis protein CheW